MTALASTGIVISSIALGVSAASAMFAHRQLQLGERRRQRDFEATVVAALTGIDRTPDAFLYELSVTNAGPAVARDVDISMVAWTDETTLGLSVARADVAPALLRGERRTSVLNLTLKEAHLNDHSVSIELWAGDDDDNGVRNERVAWAFASEDSRLLAPMVRTIVDNGARSKLGLILCT